MKRNQFLRLFAAAGAFFSAGSKASAEMMRAGAGDCVFVPRKVPQSFSKLDEGESRMR